MQKVAIATILFATLLQGSPFPFAPQDQLILTGADQQLRLIELGENERRWMSEAEIDGLIATRTGFMDVTFHSADVLDKPVSDVPVPTLPQTCQQETIIRPLIQSLDTGRMEKFLTKFSSFRNRYYDSYGLESANFLFGHLEKIVESSGANISLSKFGHSWKQFSIIARFNSAGLDNDKDAVIIGAHQDSINIGNRREGIAPGADDDGSGTTSILEAFTVLAQANIQFTRPVEFHWYSAEEVGLLGSQDVAARYSKDGRKVLAMIQNDLTGYVDPATRRSKSFHFGIITDYTNPTVTRFVKMLIEKYATMSYVETKCGYACSDHASWTKYGYPSAFAVEGRFSESNPYLHSERDTVKEIDFAHAVEYSKLALSFAVELGMFSK